jgi:hypothetical protein
MFQFKFSRFPGTNVWRFLRRKVSVAVDSMKLRARFKIRVHSTTDDHKVKK